MSTDLAKELSDLIAARAFSVPLGTLEHIAHQARQACSEFCQKSKLKGFTLEVNGVDASHAVERWPAQALKSWEKHDVQILVRLPDSVQIHVNFEPPKPVDLKAPAPVAPSAPALNPPKEEHKPEDFAVLDAPAPSVVPPTPESASRIVDEADS